MAAVSPITGLTRSCKKSQSTKISTKYILNYFHLQAILDKRTLCSRRKNWRRGGGGGRRGREGNSKFIIIILFLVRNDSFKLPLSFCTTSTKERNNGVPSYGKTSRRHKLIKFQGKLPRKGKSGEGNKFLQ